MSNHTEQIVPFRDGRFQARCSCNSVSNIVAQRWEAEDWGIAHRVMVERVKSALGTRSPSLKQQRDYFQSQADDTDQTREHRDLWQQLADEISQRLNEGGLDPALQPPLFDLESK
jgi:hypothetical protein